MHRTLTVLAILVVIIGSAVTANALRAGSQSAVVSVDTIHLSSGSYTVNGPGQVTGTVVSSSGIAVQGDPLYWRVGSSSSAVASGGPVYSGSTGAFTITVGAVPIGTYTLSVSESSSFCGTSCGLALATAQYVSSTTSLYTVKAELVTSGGTLPPNPDGATVVASQSGTPVGQCVTDSSDSCGISLPSGAYSVSASFQGYATQSPVSVTVNGAPVTVQLDLVQVQLYGSLTLSFTAPGGAGVSGVVVTAGSRSITSGTNGTVHFFLPVGTYDVTYTPPSQYGSAQVIPGVKVQAQQNWEFTTTFGSYTGTIAFVDASSRSPIQGVEVDVSALSFKETTGSNGSVSFDGASGQTYSFTYTPSSPYNTAQEQGSITLTVSPGTNTVTIPLSSGSGSSGPSCTLSPSTNTGVTVLVVNSTGSPIDNAQVSGGGTSAVTDAQGYASLCNFPVPGQGAGSSGQTSITVSASASGYKPGSSQVNVVEGQLTSVTVQLTSSKIVVSGGSLLLAGIAVIAVGGGIFFAAVKFDRRPKK